MRQLFLLASSAITLTIAFATPAQVVHAQRASDSRPYKVLRTAKVGGDGGFDYVYADSEGRRLYVARRGRDAASSRVSVFDLDTLAPVGEVANVGAHGAEVDPKSHHAFASSKPIAMWDSKTLIPIKTIDMQGNPDGMLLDPFSERLYVFSHVAPNATLIDTKDGTVDLGGAPEQAATDGKGHLYVDLEDKDQVAVVDTKTMKVTAHYNLGGKGGGPGGLALDAKNHVLFVACHNPATMVMLNADTGKILDALPINAGTDGATFNPKTMEAFSSQGDGTLTVIKENSPTSFAVEQTVQTQAGAKTLTLDTKTNRVLLIAAEYDPPAADAKPGPGGRAPRGPMKPGSFSIIEVGK